MDKAWTVGSMVLLLTLVLYDHAGVVSASDDMHALHQRLLSNYSVHVRPVLREDTVLPVNLTLHLLYILELDLKQQILKSAGFLDIVWKDEYLQWDPADYGNITDFLIPQTMVWRPDTVVSNDVRGVFPLGTDKTLVLVRHDGTVTWQPDFNSETGCKVNIYQYPFDTQTCSVEVMPWMYTSQYISMKWAGPRTDSTRPNNEFQMVATSFTPGVFPVTFSTDPLELSLFSVTLKRRSIFYLLSTVLPLAAFSLLSPLALLVPADSGEKITLSVTVLLANLVFMGSLSDSIPSVADSVSVFVLYTSLQILLSFASVIVNVVALCMSRMSSQTGNDAAEGNSNGESNTDQTRDEKPGFFSKMVTCFLYVLRCGRKAYNHEQPKKRTRSVVIRNGSVYKPSGSAPQSPTTESSFSDIAVVGVHLGSDTGTDISGTAADREKKPPAIARRDKICFTVMLLITITVNVTTMSILLSG